MEARCPHTSKLHEATRLNSCNLACHQSKWGGNGIFLPSGPSSTPSLTGPSSVDGVAATPLLSLSSSLSLLSPLLSLLSLLSLSALSLSLLLSPLLLDALSSRVSPF